MTILNTATGDSERSIPALAARVSMRHLGARAKQGTADIWDGAIH